MAFTLQNVFAGRLLDTYTYVFKNTRLLLALLCSSKASEVYNFFRAPNKSQTFTRFIYKYLPILCR